MRPICFYLPQFHPIPENDRWWGKGFTEWTNVRKSRPRFPGHYQPHIPSQLGYYDLRDADIKESQAALARKFGIYGFCYYHYWFNSKRLLETPISQVLETGQPDFPFCLCWANENWTRRWDGGDKDILIAQKYNHDDDSQLIKSLVSAFRDERYIRVNGKPLFIVYSSDLLPDPKRTTEVWRTEMHKAGIGDLYLARVEKQLLGNEPNPLDYGFDAAIEFAPNWGSLGPAVNKMDMPALLSEDAAFTAYDYEKCMYEMLGREKPDYKLFRGVFPSWDNSARRSTGPTVFLGSSPEKYAFWLSQVARYTLEVFEGDERLIFVNAWNEWAEGCHLEPDEKNGLQYLEATQNALKVANRFQEILLSLRLDGDAGGFPFQQWYENVARVVPGQIADEREFFQKYQNFIEYQVSALLNSETTESLERRLREKERQVADMKATLSWTLTEPIRKLGNFLSGRS